MEHRSLTLLLISATRPFPPPLPTALGPQRLSFKTRLKLARLYVAQADWERLAPLLRQLQDAALGPAKGAGAGASSGGGDSDDRSRATQALEVFALQIQMYTETRDMKRLAATYKAS